MNNPTILITGAAGNLGGLLVFFLLTAAILATTCGTANKPQTTETSEFENIITMTTSRERVTLDVYGSGTATINWGDGTKTDTIEFDRWNRYWALREFSNTNSRVITVTGENITGLECSFNQLTELDVSRNTTLTMLECNNNQLTALDLSQNIALTHLKCHKNLLTELDVSQNLLLTHLICHENQLIALDVSQNTALKELNCNNNQLTALDLSKNAELEMLRCRINHLTAEALNDLFATLHNNYVEYWGIYKKHIYIANNPGSAGCDPNIAEAKGWEVRGFSEPIPHFNNSSLRDVIIKTIKAYQNEDEEILNNLIHKDLGIAFLYRRGATDNASVSARISFDNPVPSYLPFDNKFETDYKINFEALPEYCCDDWEWSKPPGIYCDTRTIDKTLSRIAKFEKEHLINDWSDSEIEKFEKIERKSHKIIVAPHGFIFYLTFIDNKWWLSIIDRFEVCTA